MHQVDVRAAQLLAFLLAKGSTVANDVGDIQATHFRTNFPSLALILGSSFLNRLIFYVNFCARSGTGYCLPRSILSARSCGVLKFGDWHSPWQEAAGCKRANQRLEG